MRHGLTASRIALGRSCLWWARPEVELPAREVTKASELGTATHAVTEAEADVDLDEETVDERFRRVVLGEALDVDGAELGDAEQRRLLSLSTAWRTWWDAVRPGLSGPETEVPMALRPRLQQARALEKGEHRDYSGAEEDELPGTADLIALADAPIPGLPLVDGGDLVVLDYKTGHGPHRLADHEDQLVFLGAAAWLLERCEGCVVGVAHITPDGVLVDARRLDRFDVFLFVAGLAELLEQLPTAEPRPGLHCDDGRCPARAVCPATRALLLDAKLELEPRRRLPLVGPIVDNDQALAVLVGLGLLEKWSDERREAVKAYADAKGGVVAPDGRVWRGNTETRETPRLDAAGAMDALRLELGDRAEKAITTKVSTSWEAIKDQLRAISERGTLTDRERHVRAALRKAGAVKVSEFTKYSWKKKGKEATDGRTQ
jgi:hypothetical protein